jgi:dolichyl-phosphate beta-glucosyltransferase
MLARALGYPIAEVPIRWAHQGGSKVRLLQDGLRMIKDLIVLRFTLKRRLRKGRSEILSPS